MTKTAHDFSFKSIDGADLSLSDYAGKTVLVVNTASQCSFTAQYAGLESLHEQYGPKGLVVLGVPSNDFGGQEPGTEGEIATFCETSFGVKFPMTAKAVVLGDDAHPFYKWARDQLGEGLAPKWNFHKYLFGKDGKLLTAVGSAVEPTSDEARAAIEAALPE